MSLEAAEQIANMMVLDPYPGLHVGALLDAVPQRAAQATPEAASADVDGVHQPRHDQGRRPQRPRRAGVQLHRSRGGHRPGSTIYYDIIRSEECVPLGHTVNANIALVTGFSLAPRSGRGDPARSGGLRVLRLRARTRSSPTIRSRAGPTCGASSRLAARPTATEQRDRRRRRAGRHVRELHRHPGRRARAISAQMRDVGVDQVIFIQQAGRNRHADICSSLELFAAEVLPEFAAERGRAPAAQAGRAGAVHRGRARPQAVDAAARRRRHPGREGLGQEGPDERQPHLTPPRPSTPKMRRDVHSRAHFSASFGWVGRVGWVQAWGVRSAIVRWRCWLPGSLRPKTKCPSPTAGSAVADARRSWRSPRRARRPRRSGASPRRSPPCRRRSARGSTGTAAFVDRSTVGPGSSRLSISVSPWPPEIDTFGKT